MRSFFNFLVNEGVVKNDPCASVDSPKLWKRLPNVLSQADADTLTLVNILSYDYTAPVTLPAGWKGAAVTDLA